MDSALRMLHQLLCALPDPLAELRLCRQLAREAYERGRADGWREGYERAEKRTWRAAGARSPSRSRAAALRIRNLKRGGGGQADARTSAIRGLATACHHRHDWRRHREPSEGGGARAAAHRSRERPGHDPGREGCARQRPDSRHVRQQRSRCPRRARFGTVTAESGDDDSPLPVTSTAVGPPELAHLLAAHTYTYRIRYRKRKGGDGKDEMAAEQEEFTPPAAALAAALAPKEWPKLRPLAGIVGAPVLRRDGTLLQEPGYDAVTGLYLASKVPLDRVPEEPTSRAGRPVAGVRPWSTSSVISSGRVRRTRQTTSRYQVTPHSSAVPADADPVRAGHVDDAGFG